MKLFQIYNVCFSSDEKPVSAWNALGRLALSPDISYRQLTYSDNVVAEFNRIEKYRIKLVYEICGVPEGSEAEISPGTPQHVEFSEKFNAFTEQEANLEPIGISMANLIKDLALEKSNRISKSNLELLKPFFVENPKPDLKVVEN